jgi:hypothetical protein
VYDVPNCPEYVGISVGWKVAVISGESCGISCNRWPLDMSSNRMRINERSGDAEVNTVHVVSGNVVPDRSVSTPAHTAAQIG